MAIPYFNFYKGNKNGALPAKVRANDFDSEAQFCATKKRLLT
jgi:hypothetical protein